MSPIGLFCSNQLVAEVAKKIEKAASAEGSRHAESKSYGNHGGWLQATPNGRTGLRGMSVVRTSSQAARDETIDWFRVAIVARGLVRLVDWIFTDAVVAPLQGVAQGVEESEVVGF